VVVREIASRALRDLAWAPEQDAEVEPVRADSPEGLAVLRHSTAHVMAQAVQDLFPGTLLGIGPPIADGFYYDFLPSRPFTPDDLAAIEKKMGEIIKAGQRFSRRPVTDADARIELDAERFKLELDGSVPRTASAHDAAHPGVPAHAYGGCVLARQREEPATTADLRHRLGIARRPEGISAKARGGGQARPP
jgi:threonyl-tRNA synthetase